MNERLNQIEEHIKCYSYSNSLINNIGDSNEVISNEIVSNEITLNEKSSNDLLNENMEESNNNVNL